jgi:hypothetical protein
MADSVLARLRTAECGSLSSLRVTGFTTAVLGRATVSLVELLDCLRMSSDALRGMTTLRALICVREKTGLLEGVAVIQLRLGSREVAVRLARRL